MSDQLSSTQAFLVRLGASLCFNFTLHECLPARQGMACRVAVNGEEMLLKYVGVTIDDPTVARRIQTLQREAQLLADLRMVDDLYIDHGELDSVVWLLRRWISGVSAWKYCSYVRSHPLEDKYKYRFVADLCMMLEKVIQLEEAGYLHGDLQPNHFIVDNRGEFHLIDLELAIDKGDSESGYGGALVHFASPETAVGMLANNHTIRLDLLSEVYSFGAVAFFLYTGKTANAYGDSLEGDDLKDISKEQKLIAISQGRTRSFAQVGAEAFPELERVLKWCLEVDRNQRCPTFSAARAALEHILYAYSLRI
jgi:hypothetical protein